MSLILRAYPNNPLKCFDYGCVSRGHCSGGAQWGCRKDWFSCPCPQPSRLAQSRWVIIMIGSKVLLILITTRSCLFLCRACNLLEIFCFFGYQTQQKEERSLQLSIIYSYHGIAVFVIVAGRLLTLHQRVRTQRRRVEREFLLVFVLSLSRRRRVCVHCWVVADLTQASVVPSEEE